MHLNIVGIFFKLAQDQRVAKRAFRVAIIVGIILNIINQWELLITLNIGDINYFKFFLTFMVPYMVSTYSSVMAKLSFQVGEVAPMNATLRCRDCEGEIIQLNKGEVVPECDKCIGRTKWIIIERGTSSPRVFENDQESMALFAEFNPAPVFRFDTQGVILISNPAANHVFDQDIVGEDVHKLLKELLSYDFTKIVDRGEIKSFVEKINRKTYRFEIRGVPKMGVCQVYGADITEILETRLNNIRLSAAIEQTSNSILITNTKGDIVLANKAFEKVTGYSQNEVLGKNPRFLKTDFLPKEEYEKMWKTITKGDVWRGEFHNRKKNGQTYWEEATISPIIDENGKIINYMAVKEDVTEQKANKLEMRSMALFAELNPEPVFRFNREGIIMKANPAANEGFNSDSIVDCHVSELLTSSVDLDLNNLIGLGEIVTLEQEIGDSIFRFILRGLPELDVCQIYGSDVTLRRKAEQKVRKQNEHIAQSINYASRIQNAVLPSGDKIAELMPEHFILFKPRDIVSGDFYWMARNENKLILTAADCTGHGVPGAFMSMLGVSFLNEIVLKERVNKAHEILNKLRVSVKSTLSQSGGENDTKDGMDMALCIIDYDTMTMQFAGAYNPLYLVRNSELIQYKADRMPIGVHLKEKATFTNHEISLEKGDSFYIFSDGYMDQFGGDEGRKFSSKAFKELILSMQEKSMAEQRVILGENFKMWRGNHSQIDDVLVIGGKI
ncbi:MAG: nitrate/nitrite transporter NrtS [Salinivirgaceae bacterium]|jgi:PAS domain S-box-containing protein|nr:nitrate/nitrite transporter NrtS [Salinivirgaceae bacterium]